MSFDRILVATDFSAPAEHAVERAALLAKRSGAELRLVHAVPERSLVDRLFPSSRVTQVMMTRGVETVLQSAARAIEQRFDVVPSWSIQYGSASRAIRDAQAEFDADLLVIGVRGEGAPTLLSTLGGTALKLLALGTTPVLLVRRPAEDQYRRLLVAVDDSEVAPRLLAVARRLADRADCLVLQAFQAPFAARLAILEIAEAAIDAYALEQRIMRERTLAALMADAGFDERIKPHVVRGDPMPVVMDHIVSVRPDLVMVGRHGAPHREGQMSMLGSVSMGVAMSAPCDVLQVR